MFWDNLSAALLLFCAARGLSYEEVAERCRISPRYFGEIVRKHTSPTLRTLEKICAGLDVTPNGLLLRRAGLDGPAEDLAAVPDRAGAAPAQLPKAGA